MDMNVATMTPNQKKLLRNGVLPEQDRADENHRDREAMGGEAFRIAQLNLKMSGLMMADYSLTSKGMMKLTELNAYEGCLT